MLPFTNVLKIYSSHAVGRFTDSLRYCKNIRNKLSSEETRSDLMLKYETDQTVTSTWPGIFSHTVEWWLQKWSRFKIKSVVWTTGKRAVYQQSGVLKNKASIAPASNTANYRSIAITHLVCAAYSQLTRAYRWCWRHCCNARKREQSQYALYTTAGVQIASTASCTRRCNSSQQDKIMTSPSLSRNRFSILVTLFESSSCPL